MPFPVGEHRIEEAEAQLGRRLPGALRSRLLLLDDDEILWWDHETGELAPVTADWS